MSTAFTRFIEIATGDYPVTLDQIRDKLKTTTSFAVTPPVEELIAHGYQPVVDVPIPTADVVVGGPPEFRDGQWFQTWVSRSYSAQEIAEKLATRKAELLRAAEDLRITQFERGFAHVFNEGTYHVQIRNDDRANLTSLRIIAKEIVAAGGSMNFPFRVYENIGVTLTAEELIAMADAAFMAVTYGYQKIWAFKDGVTNAPSMEDLPVIPDSSKLFRAPD